MPPKKRSNESNGTGGEPEKKLNKTSSDYDKLNFDFKSKSSEDKEPKGWVKAKPWLCIMHL